VTYTRENKYKGRYSIKEGSSKYTRQQQRCTAAQRGTMKQKNYCKNYNVKKKQHNKEDRFIEGNSTKQNKRARSDTRAEKRRWISLGR